jgi:opacity protein-like surface antigen
MKAKGRNDRTPAGYLLALFFLLLACALFGGVTCVEAETYIAGEFGLVFPLKNGLDVEVSGGGFPAGTSAGNLVFKNSFLGGGRLGHYFESLPWFGLSTEVFYSSPNLKQQTLFVAPSSGPPQNVPLPGQSTQLITWTTNLEFRMPGEWFEPYGGVGVGVFFAELHDGATQTDRSSTKPGLNIYAGGRYRIFEHISVFVEGKYNYVRFNFDPTPTLLGLNTNYTPLIFVFGVGYHF